MSQEPRWLAHARTYDGLREIPGPKHHKTIIGWLTTLRAWWKDDETPWCGVFVAHCMQQSGLPFPKLYMRAKEWATYGKAMALDALAPGAILVFNRAGGGHVGFYVGEDVAYYYVFGGNQSNAVNVMKLEKSRLVAARWPRNEPVVGKPVRMKGGKVSTDER